MIGPNIDPIEAALIRALDEAVKAGQWSIVSQIGSELAARRNEREGVISFEAERAKRGVK